MKFQSIFLILTLCATLSEAQNRLKLVMDTQPVGSVIRISKYLGDMPIALDSMRYRGEAEINFAYDQRYTDGIYVIDVSTLESFQFVLVGKENITAHIYESGSGMAFKADGSKENDAFNIMLNLADVFSMSMDTISMTMNNLSDFSPRREAITDSLTGVYHRVALAYNNSLNLLTDLFPNSYTAQVLVKLDMVPVRTEKPEWDAAFDTDPAFNHVHYFHYIPFKDERITSNPFLSNKILEYLFNYTERSEQGVKASIDRLLGVPNMHPKVQAFIIDLLMDFFMDKNADEFVDHLNRNYLGTCELPLSPQTLKQMEQMVKFNSGDAVPVIKLPNQTGHSVPLTVLTADLNVVVFWASWCPHCVRELPKLKELYDQMPGKLGVYAISIDTVKADWLNVVNAHQLKWLNVIDEKGWDSPHLETFGITSTPSLILLDRELRWIGRAASLDGLHELVRKQLAE